MLFNSVDFAIFLPVVFIIYWILNNQNLKIQNSFVVIASYIFYGWWDWRFLSLIIFSSFVDYIVGRKLSEQTDKRRRKIILAVSIFVNIGLLGFFKYYNFFAESFINTFSLFGNHFEITRLNLVLPIGISFYTFQTLSYSIDVYRRKLEPTKDIIAFFAFVSFFPQLVAGPIERATNLLPQFKQKRIFEYEKAVDGLRQILWGLFKKIVIADNCAEFANLIFNNSSEYNGSTLLVGAFLFAFQIYGDFSGYSDIAIGTARLFGFNLMQNFNFPYFSRNIAEFWRRWHISLSTWFRDYVYIPLGGSKGNRSRRLINTFVIFTVSGFWHGANWTFIIWGILNFIYFVPLLLSQKNRKYLNDIAEKTFFPTAKEFLQICLTFLLTSLAWIFFRAESVSQACKIISEILSHTLFTRPEITGTTNLKILLFLFLAIEWIGRKNEYAIAKIGQGWNRIFRYSFYYLLIFSLFMFKGGDQEFIYFQF